MITITELLPSIVLIVAIIYSEKHSQKLNRAATQIWEVDRRLREALRLIS